MRQMGQFIAAGTNKTGQQDPLWVCVQSKSVREQR